MKRHLSTSTLLVLIFVLTSACQRESRPIGGQKTAPLGAPGYDAGAVAHVSALPSVSYVSAVSPQSEAAPAALDPAALFIQNCSACHQATGQGIPAVFPPLDNSPYVLSDNVERMASIMVYGLSGPITVLGQQYASAMAPLGSTLSNEQLAAIATYVRSSWSNKAGPVDAEVFANVRAKWGTRGPFNIQELGEEK